MRLMKLLLLTLLALGAALLWQWPALQDAGAPVAPDLNLTLKETAQQFGVPVKELLHLLYHDYPDAWSLPRQIPLRELPVPSAVLADALVHLAHERHPAHAVAITALWTCWCLGVAWFVLSLRPMARWRRLLLFGAVAVFGFLFAGGYGPMETLVKALKLLAGLEGDVFGVLLLFTLFTALSLSVPKLLCGWACPLGALQELLHRLLPARWRRPVPYRWSLLARVLFILAFLALLFGWQPWVQDYVLTHELNYFKLFTLYDLPQTALLLSPLLLVLAVLTFRPYCHYLCPFGLWSWLLERFARRRIVVDRATCINCGACVRACPTEAMAHTLAGCPVLTAPDCWSCGRCRDACPVDAIRFG